jgi:hypothetical protein
LAREAEPAPAAREEAARAGAEALAAGEVCGKPGSPARRRVAAARAALVVQAVPEAAQDLELAVAQAVEGPVAAELAEEPATDQVEDRARAVEVAQESAEKAEAAAEDLEAVRAVAPVEWVAEQVVRAEPEELAEDRAAEAELEQAAELVAEVARRASLESGRRPRQCSRAECWAECRACRAEWQAERADMR